MKRRGSGETSLMNCFVRKVYKVMAISSELMARLSGVRKESRGLVVYEKGIVKEVIE